MNLFAAIVVVTNLGFSVGYDADRNHPVWASYDLEPCEVVKADRKSFKFVPDPRIPVQTNLVWDYDYCPKVGWDRGHLCPAADFNWSTNVLRETYYFSNIVPMAAHVNRGEWSRIEAEVRHLAESGTVHVLISLDYSGWYAGPGNLHFPKSMTKTVWGWFGIKSWTVANERNDADTEAARKRLERYLNEARTKD